VTVEANGVSCTGSGSGYDCEGGSGPGSGAPRNKIHKLLLACPTCGTKNKLPPGGVAALPPHYMLQHRMILASLNHESTRLLCDLCSTDIPVRRN